MKPQQVKLALAAVWMLLAVVIIAASGYLDLRSTSDVLMLAALAVAPPAAIWFWWNDPAQTLSESIQAISRNDPGKTTRR